MLRVGKELHRDRRTDEEAKKATEGQNDLSRKAEGARAESKTLITE